MKCYLKRIDLQVLSYSKYSYHTYGLHEGIWQILTQQFSSSYKISISLLGMEWQMLIDASPKGNAMQLQSTVSGIELTTFAFQVKYLNHPTTTPLL